jgi:hypothetical protein
MYPDDETVSHRKSGCFFRFSWLPSAPLYVIDSVGAIGSSSESDHLLGPISCCATQVREDVMHFVISAKRCNSVFAKGQESAIVNAQNVMNLLMSYLESQEGRMTSLGRYAGSLRPALANTGKPCHTPNHQVLGTGSSPDRLAIRSW